MTISVRVCEYSSINAHAPLPTPGKGGEGIYGMMRIEIFRDSVALAVAVAADAGCCC